MEKKSIKKEAMRNSLYKILSSLINRIGALIFTVCVARILLPEAFGTYTLALSIALIFYTFTDLGINLTLSRYVSMELNKNKNKAKAYARYLFKIKLFLALLFSFALLVFSYPISFLIFKKPQLFLPLIFAAFYILIFSLDGFFGTFFYIIKKVKYLVIKEILIQVLRIFLVITFFSFVAKTFYVASAFISQIISILLALILSIFWLRKLIPKLLSKSQEKIDKKETLKFSFFMTISSISSVFFIYIDTIMLGLLIPDSSFVGYYRAAFSIVMSIASLLLLNFVFLPIFSQTPQRKLKRIFNKVMGYSFALTIPSVFGLIVLGKYILKLLYGYNYLLSYLPLIFLSFIIIETSSGGLLYSLLSAKGKLKNVTLALISATFLNIILNFFLISWLRSYSFELGMVGASLATLTSRAVYFSCLIFLVKKELNLVLKIKNILKPFTASLIMFFSLILIKCQIYDMNLVLGILLVFSGILIYFLFLLLLRGIDKEDFEIFRSLLRI